MPVCMRYATTARFGSYSRVSGIGSLNFQAQAEVFLPEVFLLSLARWDPNDFHAWG